MHLPLFILDTVIFIVVSNDKHLQCRFNFHGILLQPLNRVGQPREIGKACLFLAVDATFTTGEELMCAGGIELI
jgi:NAD(P)-dependent dehydrogenase (short-subunit alcohol dehydrogenase family)